MFLLANERGSQFRKQCFIWMRNAEVMMIQYFMVDGLKVTLEKTLDGLHPLNPLPPKIQVARMRVPTLNIFLHCYRNCLYP